MSKQGAARFCFGATFAIAAFSLGLQFIQDWLGVWDDPILILLFVVSACFGLAIAGCRDAHRVESPTMTSRPTLLGCLHVGSNNRSFRWLPLSAPTNRQPKRHVSTA
jgi:hypothetical protein